MTATDAEILTAAGASGADLLAALGEAALPPDRDDARLLAWAEGAALAHYGPRRQLIRFSNGQRYQLWFPDTVLLARSHAYSFLWFVTAPVSAATPPLQCPLEHVAPTGRICFHEARVPLAATRGALGLAFADAYYTAFLTSLFHFGYYLHGERPAPSFSLQHWESLSREEVCAMAWVHSKEGRGGLGRRHPTAKDVASVADAVAVSAPSVRWTWR